MSRILIIDDHELIREGLKRVLLEAGVTRNIGEAASVAQALVMLRQERWHFVILDLNLPDGNGLDVLREIRTLESPPRTLVLSIVPEDQVALRVLRAGANGFLSKATAARDLVQAIANVASGGTHVSSVVAAQLVESLRADRVGLPHETLSEREDQVFRRIVAGRTVGQIAAELHLSAKTVSSYRVLALRKLGVDNNAQMMSYAYRHGLAETGKSSQSISDKD